jgi:FixJ family two-component response regulator
VARRERYRPARQSSREKRVIAIVDDDFWVREAIANYLRSRGFPVAAFPSAEDFLRSDDLDRTTCVVIDIQLPGLSGFELQRELRAAGRTTPVIFVTALADEDVRTRAMAAGAVAFLRKPFEAAAFDRCLDSALHG